MNACTPAPAHCDEFPADYSSTGCSPAEPVSASPVLRRYAVVPSSQPCRLDPPQSVNHVPEQVSTMSPDKTTRPAMTMWGVVLAEWLVVRDGEQRQWCIGKTVNRP
jgi:hypothetical protein